MTCFAKLSIALLLPCLLASGAVEARQPSGDSNITWLLRTPEQIERVGRRMGLAKQALALAYPWQKPCRIVTTRPPALNAPIKVVRDWLDTLNHELRHCREGAWHPINLREPQ